MSEKIYVILPAYNEEEVIAGVLDKIKTVIKTMPRYLWKLVVVDDCSADNTGVIAGRKGATVLRHIINRGLGGALATGFSYARLGKADILVTLDSDGQHDPKDIVKLIEPVLDSKADLVIGTRNKSKMPFDRKLITLMSTAATYILFGIWCRDTQSGFRAFGKKAIEKINIITQKMEVSSEFFSEIKRNNLSFAEIPIRVIYTPYSRRKGQANLNSINILLRLLLRLAR